MSTLVKKFQGEIVPTLQKELSIKNPTAVPKMVKIVINIGLADALREQKLIEDAVSQLALIGGQKPVVTKAKKAIAGFKLRAGDAIGVMVTLRGNRMYDFFEKLVSVVLPRVKDFHGVSETSFDGNGNYSLGFSEMGVFPEVDTVTSGKNMGLEITIRTTAKTDENARKLLELLGMPFKKSKGKN